MFRTCCAIVLLAVSSLVCAKDWKEIASNDKASQPGDIRAMHFDAADVPLIGDTASSVVRLSYVCCKKTNKGAEYEIELISAMADCKVRSFGVSSTAYVAPGGAVVGVQKVRSEEFMPTEKGSVYRAIVDRICITAKAATPPK